MARKYDLWRVDITTWTLPEKEIAELYDRYAEFDLVVDSRLASQVATTLFFALPGEQQDGADFIPSLIESGVRHFVVRSSDHIVKVFGAVFTIAPDPVALLQQLAAHHRKQLSPPAVVAITGSNGKTIVKDWLTELLSPHFSVCATPRSYNSQIGVPLSVWRMRAHHEIGVFEAGISEPGEMVRLAAVIQPTCGILTNIGTAHLTNFHSSNQLLTEKLALFHSADWILADDDLADTVNQQLPTIQTIAWSGCGRNGLELSGQRFILNFPDLPKIYLANARIAAAAAIHLGVTDLASLQSVIAHLHPLANRLEQRAGRGGGVIINDSYSNDFSALAAALEFAERQDSFGHVTLILGTVQPLPDLDQKIASLVTDRVKKVLLVGDQHRKLAKRLPWATHLPSAETVLSKLHRLDFQHQTVLIKGASYEHFDRIADRLSLQRHRTVLRVDLAALRHNLRTYRQLLPTDCKLLVMTKASAYGSGALPVARLLQASGADRLAVAYTDEGRALRRGGVHLPILVLNPEPHTFPDLVEAGLEPAIHSIEQFRLAKRLSIDVHLEIDTGMGRLGFSPEAFLAHLPELISPNVKAIFTHLAASEEAAHDDYTQRQIQVFSQLYDAYRAGGGAPVQRHVLNSNGIGRFPQARYEMVRLGIGLYGIGDARLSPQLQSALSLTATISSICEFAAGQTIGYGRRGRVVADSRIAVVSIGYADGLPRSAGEGKFRFLLHGELVPTIGAICMDMCMCDVSDVAEARVGDVITVFGPDHPIELLATAANTIPYEILTGIGSRVHRVYVGE